MNSVEQALMELVWRITLAIVELFIRVTWTVLASLIRIAEENPRESLSFAIVVAGASVVAWMLITNPLGFLSGASLAGAVFIILRDRLR